MELLREATGAGPTARPEGAPYGGTGGVGWCAIPLRIFAPKVTPLG